MAKAGVYKKLWDGIKKNYEKNPNILATSKLTHTQAVADGNYAFISDRTILERIAIADTSCQLLLLSAHFLPMALGIGIHKDVPYRLVIEKT